MDLKFSFTAKVKIRISDNILSGLQMDAALGAEIK